MKKTVLLLTIALMLFSTSLVKAENIQYSNSYEMGKQTYKVTKLANPEVNEDGYPLEEKEAGSNRVDYDNLCSTDKGVQKAFRIVGYVVLITRWAGPIAIIAFGVMDFVKAVYSNDEDATKKAAKSLGKRMISSIVIFLVPTILLALLNILEVTDAIQDSSAFSSCTKCVLNVKSCVSTSEE
jgi:hypothetical protein